MENQIEALYIAYYGRLPDPEGLAFWEGKLDEAGGNIADIADAFGNSQEYIDNYGDLTNTELVTGLYQQAFDRDPDAAGLEFYVGWLDDGTASLADIALRILAGASGEDLVTLATKMDGSGEGMIHTPSVELLPASDTGRSDSDGITNQKDIDLVVTLGDSGGDRAAAVGDIVCIFATEYGGDGFGAFEQRTYVAEEMTLTAAHISAGQVTLEVSTRVDTDGGKNFTVDFEAGVMAQDGGSSWNSEAIEVVIDTTGPVGDTTAVAIVGTEHPRTGDLHIYGTATIDDADKADALVLRVAIDDVVFDVPLNEDGTWDLDPASSTPSEGSWTDLTPGKHEIKAFLEDVAGNPTDASNSAATEVIVTAPVSGKTFSDAGTAWNGPVVGTAGDDVFNFDVDGDDELFGEAGKDTFNIDLPSSTEGDALIIADFDVIEDSLKITAALKDEDGGDLGSFEGIDFADYFFYADGDTTPDSNSNFAGVDSEAGILWLDYDGQGESYSPVKAMYLFSGGVEYDSAGDPELTNAEPLDFGDDAITDFMFVDGAAAFGDYIEIDLFA